jgi:hypothetical protein
MPQLMLSNPVETRIATVFLDENSVVKITMKDCGTIDEYDIVDLNLVVRRLTDSKKSLKLVILKGNWDMTKKAKEMAQQEDAIAQTKARAIVVSGVIKASLLNFIRQFSEKDYPQQFFNDPFEAYQWLLGFKEEKYQQLMF